MKISNIVLVLLGALLTYSIQGRNSPSAYNNPNGKIHQYKCGENLSLSINYTINKANLSYKGDVLTRCENRDMGIQGEMLSYGEGQATIRCRGGDVVLHNDYDELVLRPSQKIQKIYKSMDEYEFFCEEI